MPLEGATGISSALGYAVESTWGVSVAPSKWIEWLPGETMNRKQNVITSQSMGANQIAPRSSRTVATTRKVEGNIPLEVPTKGFAAFLQLLHGEPMEEAGVKTINKVEAGVFQFINKIGTTDPFKKSLTIVKAAPKVGGGVVDSYCYPGFILNGLSFSCATGGMLMATLESNAKDETQEQSIGAATFPAAVGSFNFVQCVVKVAGVEQKLLRDVAISFKRPVQSDRSFLGSATMSQALTSGLMDAKLEVTADYGSQELYKLFEKTEVPSAEVVFTGGIIATTNKFELKFVCPAARVEGDSPNVDSLGPVTQKIPFKLELGASGEPLSTITYQTSDTTI